MEDDAQQQQLRLLKGLLRTDEDDLETFRRRRVANSAIDLAAIRRAQALVTRIAAIIAEGDAADWKQLERAHQVLVEGGEPGAEDAVEMGTAAAATAVALAGTGAAPSSAPSADEPARIGAPPSTPQPAPAPVAAVATPSLPERPAAIASPANVSPANVSPANVSGAPSPWSGQAGPSAPAAIALPAPIPLAPAAAAPAAIAPPAIAPPAAVPVLAPPAMAPPAAVPAMAAPASTRSPTGPTGETAFLSADALFDGVALPFEDGGAAAVPAPAATSLPPVGNDINGTAMFDSTNLDFGDALPFDDGPAPAGASAIEPPPIELAPEQYASLCAEQIVAPANSAAINVRYGLPDPAARAALDRHWQQRFAADPTLEQRHHQLVAQYADWFRRQA